MELEDDDEEEEEALKNCADDPDEEYTAPKGKATSQSGA